MIGNQGENLVFLLSMPRSGSTLLSLLLGNHPDIHCPPEPWLQLLLAECCIAPDDDQLLFDEYTATLAMGELIRNAVGLAENRIKITKAFLELFSKQCKEDGAVQFASAVYNTCTSQAGKQIFVDKTPRYYHVLDFLDRVYPAARKILLKRNPLDIVLSYRSTWGVPVDEMVGQVATPNTVDFAKGLFELERYASSPRADVFVVAYEDLVSNPESCLRQVCGFLGVDFSPNMLAFHASSALLAAQKASAVGDRKVLRAGRSVDKTSLGKWRSGLSLNEKSRLAAFLGKDLFERYGYQQTIQDLVEDGVEFLPEKESEAMRSTALVACKASSEISSRMGRWAYLIACTDASASELGIAVELLVQRLRGGDTLLRDNVGEVILDLVRRYHLSECDRSERLGEIERLTTYLKTASEQRDWAERTEQLLAQERETSKQMRAWAERTEAQVAQERESTRQTRNWAERTEALLKAEREVSRQMREVMNNRRKLFARLISRRLPHD